MAGVKSVRVRVCVPDAPHEDAEHADHADHAETVNVVHSGEPVGEGDLFCGWDDDVRESVDVRLGAEAECVAENVCVTECVAENVRVTECVAGRVRVAECVVAGGAAA